MVLWRVHSDVQVAGKQSSGKVVDNFSGDLRILANEKADYASKGAPLDMLRTVSPAASKRRNKDTY